MSDPGPDPADPPVVQVTRGRPSDTELAALVAVLCARASVPAPPSPARRRSAWGDPAVLLRGRTASLGWRTTPAAPH